MNPISIMQASLTNMDTHLSEFCERLKHAQLIQADIFQIPPATLADEGKMTVDDFSVTHLCGQAALDHMMSHVRSYYAKEDESRRIARRLPGLIVIQTREIEPLLDCAYNIRKEKHDFYNALQRLPGNAEERHEIVHKAL